MSAINPTEVDIIKWLGVVANPESKEAGLMAASLVVQAFRQLECANAILSRELVSERTAQKRRAEFKVVGT